LAVSELLLKKADSGLELLPRIFLLIDVASLVSVVIFHTELSNRSKALDVRLFAMPGLPKVVVGLYSEPGASFADAGQL
jgi:hypothetical protein